MRYSHQCCTEPPTTAGLAEPPIYVLHLKDDVAVANVKKYIMEMLLNRNKVLVLHAADGDLAALEQAFEVKPAGTVMDTQVGLPACCCQTEW